MTGHFENSVSGAISIIIGNARKLRKKQTDAERRLWEKIRNRKFRNLKFLRQHPIKKYTADFYCAEYKIVIELDGGIHNNIYQIEYDEIRTKNLEKSGIRVIRFTNEEVMLNINETIHTIEKFPTPPSPNGEGVMPKA